MQCKIPISVLVCIYRLSDGKVLLLQRKDSNNFWQSVTGSFEKDDKNIINTAIREVYEETGIYIDNIKYKLINLNYSEKFEIWPQFRSKYSLSDTYNKEHWFMLEIDDTDKHEIFIKIKEHSDYQWLDAEQAYNLTGFPTNKQIIKKYLIKK